MKSSKESICILKKEECCGCGACYNKCPKDAIEMVFDEEGFLYPQVDFEKCIECGLCQQVCPSISATYKNSDKPKVYATWAEDEIRKKSSSGGMFTLLAEFILKEGGVVCGAAFDENIRVKHILIDDIKDLPRLRGSKYVMSDTKRVYGEIVEKLEEGKKVLFCGCPCQVAGMLSYAKKEYENLYTLDLLCAGATSPGLFEKYKKEVHGTREIESVDFRNKKWYGWPASMTVTYKNGKVYKRAKEEDVFYKYFLNNLAKRPFCDTCKFSRLPRQGDITLGDFWGIDKYKKKLDDGLGTSVMTINNEKGKWLFEQIKLRMKLCEEIPLQFLLGKKQPFQAHKNCNKNRAKFLKLAQEYSIEKACDYAMNDKYDVAIYGVWWGSNYGSIMTYYSLYHMIEKQGLRAIMIDRPGFKPDHPMFSTHARRFAKENYKAISPVYQFEELGKINDYVDTFVIGSDQVWNYGISKDYQGGFFLNFAGDEKRKISYAASFGHYSFSAPEEVVEETGRLLSRFDAISVRERDGVKILRRTFGIKGTRVLDPVFLPERTMFDGFAEKSKRKEESKFLTAYILDPTPEKREAILYAAKERGLEPKIMLDGMKHKFAENKKKMALDEYVLSDIEVEEWLYYIKNCEYFITDSCHGASFAIIYEKPFVCIGNEARGMSRFESLLEVFGLTDRMVLDAKEIVNNKKLIMDIDYAPVRAKLQKEREQSILWLKKALFSKKQKKANQNYKVPARRFKGKAIKIYKKHIRPYVSDEFEKKLKSFLKKK